MEMKVCKWLVSAVSMPQYLYFCPTVNFAYLVANGLRFFLDAGVLLQHKTLLFISETKFR
jgi:hypothetical protein